MSCVSGLFGDDSTNCLLKITYRVCNGAAQLSTALQCLPYIAFYVWKISKNQAMFSFGLLFCYCQLIAGHKWPFLYLYSAESIWKWINLLFSSSVSSVLCWWIDPLSKLSYISTMNSGQIAWKLLWKKKEDLTRFLMKRNEKVIALQRDCKVVNKTQPHTFVLRIQVGVFRVNKIALQNALAFLRWCNR